MSSGVLKPKPAPKKKVRWQLGPNEVAVILDVATAQTLLTALALALSGGGGKKKKKKKKKLKKLKLKTA
jgi:hypothetical protein